MGNTKSELDLLKQINARFLWQDCRIRTQTTKLSQTENAELKVKITELKQPVKNIEKQNRTVTNDLKSLEHPILLPSNNCENTQSEADFLEKKRNFEVFLLLHIKRN